MIKQQLLHRYFEPSSEQVQDKFRDEAKNSVVFRYLDFYKVHRVRVVRLRIEEVPVEEIAHSQLENARLISGQGLD